MSLPYDEIHQRLRQPRRMSFDPLDPRCSLPDDPQWPPPRGAAPNGDWRWDWRFPVQPLPRNPSLVCALVLLEMVERELLNDWAAFEQAFAALPQAPALREQGLTGMLNRLRRVYSFVRRSLGEPVEDYLATFGVRGGDAAAVFLDVFYQAVEPWESTTRLPNIDPRPPTDVLGYLLLVVHDVERAARERVPDHGSLIDLTIVEGMPPEDRTWGSVLLALGSFCNAIVRMVARRYAQEGEVASAQDWNRVATRAVERWWQLCRCRLVVADASTGTVSGLTTGSSEVYETVRTTLRPVIRAFDPLDPRCSPPDDPDWPAPQNLVEVEALFRRIPSPFALTVAAWVAVEMVAPYWQALVDERPDLKLQPAALMHRVLQGFIEGKVSREEVHKNALNIRFRRQAEWDAIFWTATNTNDERLWPVLMAAETLFEALATTTDLAGWLDEWEPQVEHAVNVIEYALAAAAGQTAIQRWHDQEPIPEATAVPFLRRWWQLVRCRLAFTDAPTATISGKTVRTARGDEEGFETIVSQLNRGLTHPIYHGAFYNDRLHISEEPEGVQAYLHPVDLPEGFVVAHQPVWHLTAISSQDRPREGRGRAVILRWLETVGPLVIGWTDDVSDDAIRMLARLDRDPRVERIRILAIQPEPLNAEDEEYLENLYDNFEGFVAISTPLGRSLVPDYGVELVGSLYRWRHRITGITDAPTATVSGRGENRPRHDSTDQLIHPTQAGIDRFWQWFAGSVVVDRLGRPLVMCHGTVADFESFSTDPHRQQLGTHIGTIRQATSRVDELGRGYREGVVGAARCIPVYLRARSPLRLPDRSRWSAEDIMEDLEYLGIITPEENQEFAEWLFDNATIEQSLVLRAQWTINRLSELGYDSIVYLNRYEGVERNEYVLAGYDLFSPTDEEFRKDVPDAEDSYIVFDPTQVKSAIGNDGSFDPDDARIVNGTRRGVGARSTIETTPLAAVVRGETGARRVKGGSDVPRPPIRRIVVDPLHRPLDHRWVEVPGGEHAPLAANTILPLIRSLLREVRPLLEQVFLQVLLDYPEQALREQDVLIFETVEAMITRRYNTGDPSSREYLDVVDCLGRIRRNPLVQQHNVEVLDADRWTLPGDWRLYALFHGVRTFSQALDAMGYLPFRVPTLILREIGRSVEQVLLAAGWTMEQAVRRVDCVLGHAVPIATPHDLQIPGME